MRGNPEDPLGPRPRVRPPAITPISAAGPSSLPVGHGPRPRVPKQVWFETKLAAASSDVIVISTLSGVLGDPITAFRVIDRSNANHGVRYRVLLPDQARIAAPVAGSLHVLTTAGADVRTVPSVPTDALVFDGTTAVLPSGQDDLAVFQIPAIVSAVTELFERLWNSAMPLDLGEPPLPGVPDRERELLTLLCLGCTDDLVATKLGISVRTVRRMVATLMTRLGARSRFQAGFKAANSGWIKRAE